MSRKQSKKVLISILTGLMTIVVGGLISAYIYNLASFTIVARGEAWPTPFEYWIVGPLQFYVLTAVIAVPLGLIFGAIMHAGLYRNRRVSVRDYIIGGVVAGTLSALINPIWIGTPLFLLNGMISGVIASVGFRLIRRPDRDPPNPATPTP